MYKQTGKTPVKGDNSVLYGILQQQSQKKSSGGNKRINQEDCSVNNLTAVFDSMGVSNGNMPEGDIGEVMNQLQDLTINKIAPHPSQRNSHETVLHEEEEGEIPADECIDEALLYKSYPASATIFDILGKTPSIFELLQGSIKLRVLVKMISRLRSQSHRILIFSQSKSMLDIIQYVLEEYGHASYLIDGSVRIVTVRAPC